MKHEWNINKTNINKFKNRSLFSSFHSMLRPQPSQNKKTKSNQLAYQKHNTSCWNIRHYTNLKQLGSKLQATREHINVIIFSTWHIFVIYFMTYIYPSQIFISYLKWTIYFHFFHNWSQSTVMHILHASNIKNRKLIKFLSSNKLLQLCVSSR